MIEAKQYKTATKIVQLGNAITYYRNVKMHALGLTSVQGDAIRAILHNPGITASRLQDLLGLSQSTTAGIVARLEHKGFLSKINNKLDGRELFLTPTQRCLNLEGQLKETALETQRLLIKGMTDEEQFEFNRLLELALTNMSSVRIGKE